MKKSLYTLIPLALTIIISQSAFADKIVFLDNNDESLQARADYIQNAKETIRAQYFTIEDDSLSRAALALLSRAAESGVRVKILVDSMHNLMLRESMAAVMQNIHPDKKKNVEIREYNTFNLLNPFRYTKRMHDKGLIIDEKYMISGGRNIANGYYGVPDKTKNGHALPIYEDSDVLVLESAAIASATRYFDDLWNSKFVSTVELWDYSADNLDKLSCMSKEDRFSCEINVEYRVKRVQKEERKLKGFIEDYQNNKLLVKYQPVEWESKAIEVKSIDFLFDDVKSQKSNLKKPENNIGVQLYNTIKEAEESVIIVTPYLVITPEQEDLFKYLKDKNVDVTIITNSKGSNDVPAANVGYEKTRSIALKHGVTVLEYQGPDTLHAKMVLLDRSKVFIGSFNWDFRSQNLNREVGVIAELPDNRKNDLTNALVHKFASIMRKTCRFSSQICTPALGEIHKQLSVEEYDALVKAYNLREQKDGAIYRILFPLIKGQL